MTNRFDDEPPALPVLQALPRETAPRPDLEERVVHALRQEGLLGTGAPRGSPGTFRILAAVAAGVVLFVAGWVSGASRASRAPTTVRPTYLLLLREGPSFQQGSRPEQRVEEYRAWAKRVRQSGVGLSGEKLKSDVHLLRQSNEGGLVLGQRVDAGAEAVTGLFFLEARDFEQAVRLARDCPHLRYGGSIEIRAIDPV